MLAVIINHINVDQNLVKINPENPENKSLRPKSIAPSIY